MLVAAYLSNPLNKIKLEKHTVIFNFLLSEIFLSIPLNSNSSIIYMYSKMI